MVSKKIQHITCNISLTNNITNSIDKHDNIATVFVDIKKDFDSIDLNMYLLNCINMA